jgi:chaperone BCS1
LSDAAREELQEKLVEGLEKAMKEGTRVSMAALQGHFIRHGAREAVEGWGELRRMAEEDKRLREERAASGTVKERFASSP